MIDEMITLTDKKCDKSELTLFRDGTLYAFTEVYDHEGAVELDAEQTRELYNSMKEYYENLDFYHKAL